MTVTGKERLSILETKLENVDSNITELRSDIKEIHGTMNDFITSADRKYATKEQVCKIEKDFTDQFKQRNQWIQWIPSVVAVLIAAISLMVATG